MQWINFLMTFSTQKYIISLTGILCFQLSTITDPFKTTLYRDVSQTFVLNRTGVVLPVDPSNARSAALLGLSQYSLYFVSRVPGGGADMLSALLMF